MGPMDVEITYSCKTRSFREGHLPDCLLSQILLRLPVKCLFRSKCVSKQWRDLISEFSFSCSYYRRHNVGMCSLPWTILFFCTTLQSSLILGTTWMVYVAFNLSSPGHHKLPTSVLEFLDGGKRAPSRVRVLACCSGLLLCRAAQHGNEMYYVCNPLTRQQVALPQRPQLHKWVSIGFLVDQEDCSFHVVRMSEFSGSSNVLDLEIFSSKFGKWITRKLSCPSPVMLSIRHREAIPYRGVFHWREYNNRIIAYDPKKNTHQCRLLDMPKDRNRDADGVLGVAKDSLCYLEVRTGLHISVWMLKNYELGEWNLVHRTLVADIAYANPPLIMRLLSNRCFLCPLAFHPLDPEIVYLVCWDSLLLYNLVTKRLEPVGSDSHECYPLSNLDLSMDVPFVLQPWPTPVHKLEV